MSVIYELTSNGEESVHGHMEIVPISIEHNQIYKDLSYN